MALKTNVSAAGIVRTSGLVPATDDHTFGFWAYISGMPTPGNFTTLFYYGDDPASYTDYIWVGLIGTTGKLGFDIDALDTLDTITAPSVGWHHFAYSRSSTTHKLYIDGVLVATLTADISGWTVTNFYIGTDTGSWITGQYEYFREYNNDKTLAQIIVEANSPTAVSTTDLWCDTPLVSDLLDDSGANRDWADEGTGNTFVDGPLPIPLDNISYATAYEITSLPADYIQIANDGTTTKDTYYKITSAVANQVIGFWFRGPYPIGGSTYKPQTLFYSETVDSAGFIGSTGQNRPSQVAILFGETYYFKVDANVGNPVPALFQGTVILEPQTAYAAGNLLIRAASMTSDQVDHYTGLPAGIIDPDTETIINFVQQLPVGEFGDRLADGTMLFPDLAHSTQPPPPAADQYYLCLYDPNFTLITRVLFDSHFEPIVRSQLIANKFYVVNRGTLSPSVSMKYASVLPDGTLSAYTDLGVTGANGSFCVNNDETIMYISPVTTAGAIKRWDMVNSVFLSDLVAGVANHKITDILVMSDGTIIALYFKSAGIGPTTQFVRAYDTTGATLWTYTPTFSTTISSTANPRLGWSANSPEAFWMWSHLKTATVGQGDARLIQLSDQTELKVSITNDVNYFSSEKSDYDPLTVTSDTCPIIELVAAPSENGSIVVIKVTIPDGSAQSFDFTAGGGLSPGTFSLLDGENETFLDVTPGSGYSIIEDPVTGWTTEYEVSNDSPNDNITIGEGETVTVTVTNTLTAPARLSGIYKIEPNSLKSNDTLWTSFDPETTEDVEIPRPFARTGLIGQ